MKKFKLKSVVVTLVATSALTFGGNAMATTTVWDYANGILIAAQTALQYSMAQLTNSGIDTVASNQAKQSQVQESLVKAQIQHDAHREDAEYIRSVSRGSQEKVVEAALQTAPSITGCVQRTMQEAQRGARRPTSGIADALIRGRANMVSDIDNWGSKINAHNQDASLCSELDAVRSVGRKNLCRGVGEVTGEGIRADADKRIGSIFAAAGTGETMVFNQQGRPRIPANAPAKYSMNQQEQDIARKVIDNITTGSKPPLLPIEAENTPAGRGYVAMTRVHDARLLTAASALTEIAERRAQPEPEVGDGPVTKAWLKVVTSWRNLDPRRSSFTGLPSQFELMDVEIRGTDLEPYMDSLKRESVENLQREQVYRTNLNTKVLWMVFQQLERQTSIQAAALAHSIEPITQESMRATREAAMRGKN
jgi:hypothetical protein